MKYAIVKNNVIKNIPGYKEHQVYHAKEFHKSQNEILVEVDDTAEIGDDISLESLKIHKIYELTAYIKDELSKGYICFNQIKMDCTENSISKFKSGIEIAQLNNEATIDVVDYNNDIHQDVALSDANQMLLELATHNRGFYYHKQNKRQEIQSITSQDELDNIILEQ